jgi:hypothetical protein
VLISCKKSTEMDNYLGKVNKSFSYHCLRPGKKLACGSTSDIIPVALEFFQLVKTVVCQRFMVTSRESTANLDNFALENLYPEKTTDLSQVTDKLYHIM